MDNKSDEYIVFNRLGQCNYCSAALRRKERVYFPNDEGAKRLQLLIDRIKTENRNRKYDCVMGISGGLDSSYLAYLGSSKWGLRILAVHVDDGFDTDISKRNIERISNFPNLNLEIISPDPKNFNELTKAYMRAGVPNLAVPQDNVLFASVYKFLKKSHLRTFLSGGNFALESILQGGNTHTAYDLRNLKYIRKNFGAEEIKGLELISALKKDVDAYIMRVETAMPLDLIDYNRDRAMEELKNYCGFEYYGAKHLENELTSFIQQYWFYRKFGVDKRTSHLSSMIVSGQLSREEAQKQYEKPLYIEADMDRLINKILDKISMSAEEFSDIMNRPTRQHSDYPTSLYLRFRRLSANLIRKIIPADILKA